MTTDIVSEITSLSDEELRPIASQVLDDNAVPAGPLSVKKIGRSAGHATAGIYLVSGRAKTSTGERTWSAVVKAVGEPEHPSPGLEYDALRELEVYRSRAFADVCGGVRSACCYAIQPRNELQLLWLEDLSDAPQPPWNSRQFIETACHLGQFNGHWPEQALPQWNWLSRHGFRAQFTGNPDFQQVFKLFPAQKNHPLARRFAPPAVAKALMQLWDECDELLIQAEATSKCICHLDCHPKNLFPMHDTGRDSYTIGIDWVKAGIANHGIDIGHLLASPMNWLELTPTEAAALRAPVFDAYLSGLTDSEWSGNKDGVRLTYLTRLACEALRSTNLISYSIDSAEWHERMEELVGLPMAEICTRYGANLEFYFDCKEEALKMAKQL